MRSQKPHEESWKLLVLLLQKTAEAKGITQTSIALATGLKQSNIARLFSLKYPPSMRTFLKVASAIKVNFYFTDEEDKSDWNQLMEQAMTELGRRPDKLPKN